VRADPAREGHYYADVQGYLDFDKPVPFKRGDFFYEAAMRGADGSTNLGSARRAVRNMSDKEFDLIVRAGFAEELPTGPRGRTAPLTGFEDEQAEIHRPMIVSTTTRPFRDLAFARQIQAAYDKKCAMTGLRIINGGGRPEAQAAHIRPVASDGPDSIRNGIALSSTFHWMFDRGLISIDDDFRILIAKGGVPTRVEQMLNPSRTLTVPDDPRAQPHRVFLRYHRENIFKG
jgi:putative restriction endonuclease